jgi:Zn-dependent peptidase ImmA (M78 family)
VKRPETRARQVLEQAGVLEAPVPVEDIAQQQGARLSLEPFKGGISGMLFRDAERTVIGVNASHARTRQRFTIAHEIGHLLLHERRSMFVDTHIYRRDEVSSMGTESEEREANAFAAELLMPAGFVEDEARELMDQHPSITARQLVARLAVRFEVSQQAMEIRLGALGILSPLIVASG